MTLATIGIIQGDKVAMQKAEATLRSTMNTKKNDRLVRRVLIEIAQSQNHNVDDVARAGIMLNPSAAGEWANLSRGDNTLAQVALSLAQNDHTIDADELADCYGKSGLLGDAQSGILLAPWRQGWEKLEGLATSIHMSKLPDLG